MGGWPPSGRFFREDDPYRNIDCRRRYAVLEPDSRRHQDQRQLFLITATPVQNNLRELYDLLTLLEPGHLKTEAEFKKTYVWCDNPRDLRNRERLRGLLGEVMIRNTR